MKLNDTLLLLSIVFVFSEPIYAQKTFTISGSVKDHNDKPVSLVNVSLLAEKDSSWIQSVFTDEAGAYQFQGISKGRYLLGVHVLGYKTATKSIMLTADLTGLDIMLANDGKQMKEVIVKGKRNRIETDLGKTILNISKEMKAGKNLLDLLKNVPGVVVSPSGSIYIEGKSGITLIIDKKPVHFTGKSLLEYLRSVDAGNVDKIELMTNPSAKYNAAGNAGIVEIKLAENKKKGLSGGFTTNYTQGMYPYWSANGRLDYHKNNTTWHFDPGYYRGESFLIPRSTTTATGDVSTDTISVIKESGFLHEVFHDYSVGMGVDHDLSKRTKAGISVKGIYHPNNQVDVYAYDIDNTHGDDILNRAKKNRGFQRMNMQATFFMEHDIDSSHNVVVNGDYFTESKKMYQYLESTNYNTDGMVVGEPFLLNSDVPVHSSVYSVKADYEGKVARLVDIEAGVKNSYVAISEPNNFEVYQNNTWVRDTVRANNFHYDQDISAAYISGAVKKGKWHGKAGIRVEHTYAKGHELVKDTQFERNYTSVFPTAYVTYKANDKNTVECNYGKRIQRPYYRELNPFTLVNSQYNYSTGNPYLLPMFTNNLELKHNYRGRFITTFSYSVSNGIFMPTLQFDKLTNVSHYSTTNNGQKRRSALSAYFNQEINDWWGVTCNARVYHIAYSGVYNNAPVQSESYGYFMNIDTQLTLKKGWYMHLNGWYSSPFVTSSTTATGASLYTSIEVSKSVWHDTGTIKLNAQDPFGLYRNRDFYNVGGVFTATNPTYNIRSISLAFSYNFGAKERNSRKNNQSEEVDRI